MGTWIVLNNTDLREYAMFDYRPGNFGNDFYDTVRDQMVVHNLTNTMDIKKLGTQITVPEWISRYGIPKCLERIYDPSGWIPF